MKNSNLYRIHPEDKLLQAVREINFADFNFKERYDIQEWVESTPEILGEELLVIAKELTYFDNTKERPDLIALDKHGNVVIIELKRDDSGMSVEWQAIKYASYLSNFKVSDIVDVYVNYNEKNSKEGVINAENASQKILDFIDEDDLTAVNKNQRIILVSHRFAKEVTSAVNWLIAKYNMDIKVVQLIPYYDKDKETHYLQSNVILPILGEEELIIKAGGKTESGNYGVGPVKKSDDVALFFNDLKNKLLNEIDKDLTPTKTSRWAGIGNNFRYYHFWYEEPYWDNWYLSFKIWLFDEKYHKVERKNKFGVFFEFYRKHLLGKGMTEERLNELTNFLEKSDIEGFKFHKATDAIYLEYLQKNENMSEKDKNSLVKTLIRLIQKTKKTVDLYLQ